jgi:hypothetical protein
MTQELFLQNVDQWNSHLPLLWLALEKTGSGPIIEMGCGHGSTRQLHEYSKATGRPLYSFDTNQTWLDQFSDLSSDLHTLTLVTDWDVVKEICPNPSVILIDHAPGERRIIDVERFKDINGIQVLHDTQPQPTAADYGWEKIWNLFDHRVDLNTGRNPFIIGSTDGCNGHTKTWAAAVSNSYDLSDWKGLSFKLGEYVIK